MLVWKVDWLDMSIDSRRLLQIIVGRKIVLCSLILAGALLGFVISCEITKEYTSTTTIQVRSVRNVDLSNVVMAAMGRINDSSLTAKYIALMKTRAVLEPVIDDITWENAKKPDASDFVKRYLDIRTVRGTDIIQISAKGKSPDEAQRIAAGVVASFMQYQTNSNGQTQSLLDKCFSERMDDAKKDADLAMEKLYRQKQDGNKQKIDELESEAKVKQEIYMNMVKLYEQNKVQEEMAALDIQVVDPADCPTEPSGPAKGRFIGGGILVGFIICVIYIMRRYRME